MEKMYVHISHRHYFNVLYFPLMYFFVTSDGTPAAEEAAFIGSQQNLPGTNCDDSHDANNEP